MYIMFMYNMLVMLYLQRMGSGSFYNSGEMGSGQGIIGQPESSQFPSNHDPVHHINTYTVHIILLY